MKSAILIFRILALSLIIAAPAMGQITVNTDITENTTWSVTDSPVSVTNTITVTDGATLTIEPGVTVKMDQSVSLLVKGALVADGTDAENILFTSSAGLPSPGDWGSIEFQNNTDAGSVFDFVTVEFGAGSNRSGMVFYTTGAYGVNISNSEFRFSLTHGVNLRASSPVISNSEFYDNNGYGIYTDLSLSYTVTNSSVYRNIQGGIRVPINSAATITESVIDTNGVGILIDNGGLPSISNNQIRENSTGIRVIEVGATKPEITDNTIAENSEWGMENLGNVELIAKFNYWGSSLGPTVATNPTGNGDKVTQNNIDYTPWRYGAADLPVVEVDAHVSTNTTWSTNTVYHLTTNISVTGAATLTIEPGTVVKFAPGTSLTVDGALIANGTAGEWIFFTSEKDDAAGGDSNSDGDATIPSRGDWGQITINGAGSQFSHAIIRYGYGSNGALDLRVATVLSNVNVSTNARDGIYSNASQSGWTNVRSVDNSRIGIYIYRQSIEMTESETSYNGQDGLFVSNISTTQTIQLSDFISNYNNRYGIYLDGPSNYNQTRFQSLTNSVVSFNGSDGIRVVQSPGGITVSGNTLEGNSGHGITLNHSGSRSNVVFENNILQDNAETGILSSQARFIDNTFEGNRFSIGAWESLGHRYTDELDVDGNVFTDNTYNNALALYATNLRDTLSITFPEAIDSGTYLLATSGNANSAEHELLIEPGVIIKGSGEMFSSQRFTLRGKFTAAGTETDPIVFTSLRDHEFGGNVNTNSDTVSAAPGDWYGLNLYHEGTADSRLQHVNIRYGRINLGLANNGASSYSIQPVQYSQPFEDIWVDQGSQEGIRIEEGAVIIDRVQSTNNGNHGITLNERSGNDFVTRAIIRNAEVTGNGTHTSHTGLYATSSSNLDGAAFTEISNSVIQENANGIRMIMATLPVSLTGNQIGENDNHGVEINSTLSRADVAYVGNEITNNSETGILSSQARFIDNTFEGNRFSIGAWESLGHRYTDELDVDGNVFTDNTYNNALALYATNLRDTLSITFPEAITSGTYLLATSGTANSADDELLIEPGVVVKGSGADLSNSRFTLRGKLTAVGTESDPIVFTSLRDHEFGGNVNVASDTLSAASGDWYGLNLYHEGTADSRLQHVNIRYGRINLGLANNGASNYSIQPVQYSQPFEDIWVDQGYQEGIRIEEGAIIMDRVRSTNNESHGITLDERSGNDFVSRAIIRNAEITGNGTHTSHAGLYANSSGSSEDGAAFTEISNSVIHGNANGLITTHGSLPSAVQFSEFSGNSGDGFFANMIDVETDTVLTFIGNTFSQNDRVGLISTRAIVKDNHFENNQMPIAIMGELSKPETINEFGNEYEGNTFGEHQLNDVIGLYSTGSISLNGKLGYNWPAAYENPVYVPTESYIYINAGDTVNVAPGAVFKSGLNGTNERFVIRGYINSTGTVDDKIVFTSIFDDTYAGDTNLDGSEEVPSRGNWRYIELLGEESSGQFKHVIARYGDTNFYLQNNTEVLIDSSFSSNANYGIYSTKGAKPTIRNSEIHHNRYGIRVTSDSDDPNIHLNNFHSNDDAGLYASRNITAINNYWGDVTGPFVDQGSDLNLDGKGNRIYISGSNEVTYRPFLTDRTGILLGDVTVNGEISPFDASHVLLHVVESNILTGNKLAAADVSGNGSVSAMDASYILQYVVGTISGFPGQGKKREVDYTKALALEYSEGSGYTDITLENLGSTPIYSSEIQLVIPRNHVESVEFIGSDDNSDLSVAHNIQSDTVLVALASGIPLSEKGELGMIRLVHKTNAGVDNTRDRISYKKFTLNEQDVTSYMNETYTSNEDNANDLPTEFVLQQNYPNPFNPSTIVAYDLPVSGNVEVRVFNILGQLVQTLVDSNQKAGSYKMRWNAGQLGSGTYLLRIDFNGDDNQRYSQVRKMLLIK